MFQIRLKTLRENRCLSQSALAKQLQVAQSTVGMWESGKNKPEYDTLTQIADFFGVSVDHLIGRDAQSPELTLDDFTYAMLGESKELTEENKQKLLEMARFFKTQQEKSADRT